jgi:hypothetical protein
MKRKHVILLVAVVVGLNAIIALVDYVDPGPSGKRSSSLATAPAGFAAWVELARRNGVDVIALRSKIARAKLPTGATVVVLDAPSLPQREARALLTFAQAGGHVVAGGQRPGRWVDILDPDVTWVSSGPRTAERTGSVPETDGVKRVVTAGRGSWRGTAGALGGLLVTRDAGAGRIALLADASPLQNAGLAKADNAALALALAGDGPLIFAESAHGYSDARGLAALPGAAKGALALLLVAAGLMMLARGRRFGPPEPESRELPPPRVAYVDALGATLARTKDHDAAMAPVRAALSGGDDLPPVRDHAGAIELAQRLKEQQR